MKAGKYLYLPPGYAGEVPEGYTVVKPKTYRVWIFLRASIADGVDIAPSFPIAHPHPSSEPVIDFRYRAIILRYTEVVHPAPKVLRKLLHAVLHGHEPAPTGQAFDSPLKLAESIVRPANFGSLKGEPQKVRVIGFGHPAFLLIDLKFKLTVKKPLDTLGHAYTGTMTFHENEKV
jgi:hypothetical protein